MPLASKLYIVRVGVSLKPVCFIACSGDSARRFAPINRSVTSSMRINPDSGFSAPVQCFVGSAVSVSLIDQMLKYGSCVISGVAGGRNGADVCAQTKGAKRKIVKVKRLARLYMIRGPLLLFMPERHH